MPPPTAARHASRPTALPRCATPPSVLALEKVIQDHIPSVTLSLTALLTMLRRSSLAQQRPCSRDKLLQFERELRRLCRLAQEGVNRMDAEWKIIERGWETVDKERWEVCRAAYKGAMKLVQEVWTVGQGVMEGLREVEFERRITGAR